MHLPSEPGSTTYLPAASRQEKENPKAIIRRDIASIFEPPSRLCCCLNQSRTLLQPYDSWEFDVCP